MFDEESVIVVRRRRRRRSSANLERSRLISTDSNRSAKRLVVSLPLDNRYLLSIQL